MPMSGNLTPPSSDHPGSLRQCSTAPNLAGMLSVNRYANLDLDSPMVTGSPPHPGLMPMKFYPLPSSKYRQLSQMNLTSTSPPKIHVDFAQKPSFTVGNTDEYESRSGCSSRADTTPPTLSLQTCDTPDGTPRGTPMGSPQLPRKRHTMPLPDLERKPSGGFLGWLTRSSNTPIYPETEFFHQKEDMHSIQNATSKSSLFKPRAKMPVSLSDINVFTPSEY